MIDPVDATARRDAVDPARSVIVQAPAGSGKTTLLVERYLALLARAEVPEEILAITFTRKAAAEMRERILKYLDPDYSSEAAHEQAVLSSARRARVRAEQWRLTANPHRLLIRTIDSFNHYLTRTMPVASQLGPVPLPADDPQALYRHAARRVLLLADQDHELAPAISLLLDWNDYRVRNVEDLLVAMLSKREQWRQAFDVAGRPDRQRQESLLRAYVEQRLATVDATVRAALARHSIAIEDLGALAAHAAANCLADGRDHKVIRLAHPARFPDHDPATLPKWQGLADLLLTKDKAQFRTPKGYTVSTGFLKQTAEKAAIGEIAETIANDGALAEALHQARQLPDPMYSDAEWDVLDALIRVLIRSALELELAAAEAGETDYAGLADAALRGLGDEDSGFTDLGLYLDSRIRHLLIDEFQDTNQTQQRLLEKLTAGWTGWDGRTLFLVGDPMQSIYRFREAEVGLFLRNRDQGVGDLPLESLKLRANFRSRDEIVHWLNDKLRPIFPEREDATAGAVQYTEAIPSRGTGGQVQLMASATPEAEAATLVGELQATLARHEADPDFRAAIIVRARSHLKLLIPALDAAGIRYRAVKLEQLLERPVVQDLLCLTRAIVMPADRTAWLAILRSPLCGLELDDLLIASEQDTLLTTTAFGNLSHDGQQRAARVQRALADAWARRSTRPLRELVEGVWLRLGGPLTYHRAATDERDVDRYLETLAGAEAQGVLDDWHDFMTRLAEARTEGDPPDPEVRLDLLTMHGAKGLEWDWVALPALERQPSTSQRTLLHWLPYLTARAEQEVLLAPLKRADEPSRGPLAQLIEGAQRNQDRFERQRLLYVAATRARETLLLSAVLEPAADAQAQPKAPPATSLLGELWRTLAEEFATTFANRPDRDTGPAPAPAAPGDAQPGDTAPLAAPPAQPQRLPAAWSHATPPDFQQQIRTTPAELGDDIDFNWAGTQARRIGTVLHRLLERLGRLGIEACDAGERQRLLARIGPLLTQQGERREQLAHSAALVGAALDQVFESETARWLLSGQHADPACELALTGLVDGEVVNAVIDRTFVDENGTRWIIDYKSGYHDGGDLPGFLAQEGARYRDQLRRYRELFRALEDRPVQTALYLPRHDALVPVDVDAER
ncbi:MAG: UvrD-helicase domain-containing protein [Pseudomonadota bacterium]